jgi:DNA polymerase-3 subunit beta
MNIVVFQENLLRQLSVAGRFLPSKTTTIPALNSFLLEARAGKITLTASNIETTLTTQVTGKIEEEGKVLLPGKTILSLIPTLSGEKISITLEDKKLLIKGEKGEVTLLTEDPSEFPLLENKEEKQHILLNKKLLMDIVEKIVFASSTDPMRAILTSVLVSSDEGIFIAAATDGFRLAKIEKKVDLGFKFPRIALPSKVVETLGSLVKDVESQDVPVSLLGEGNQVLFTLGTTKLLTQVVEGTFPDYKRIIPEGAATKIIVNREEFLRGVKFASILAREASNIIRLKIAGSSLVITANAPQTGDNKISLAVEKTGADVESAFNYRFLIDFLGASTEENVTFETNGSLSPGVFHFAKDQDYLYIVMPVRLQDS